MKVIVFPGLGTVKTEAIFQHVGKYCKEKHELKRKYETYLEEQRLEYHQVQEPLYLEQIIWKLQVLVVIFISSQKLEGSVSNLLL